MKRKKNNIIMTENMEIKVAVAYKKHGKGGRKFNRTVEEKSNLSSLSQSEERPHC